MRHDQKHTRRRYHTRGELRGATQEHELRYRLDTRHNHVAMVTPIQHAKCVNIFSREPKSLLDRRLSKRINSQGTFPFVANIDNLYPLVTVNTFIKKKSDVGLNECARTETLYCFDNVRIKHERASY